MSLPSQVEAANKKSKEMIQNLKDGKNPVQTSAEGSESQQPGNEPAPMGEVQHGVQPTNPEPVRAPVSVVPDPVIPTTDDQQENLQQKPPVSPDAIIPVDEHNKLRMEYNSILGRFKIMGDKHKAEREVFEDRFTAMQHQILGLMGQVEAFKNSLPAGQPVPTKLKYVTDDDKNEFGDPLIGVQSRVAQSIVEEAVGPLREKLIQQELEIFVERLKNRVPNYEEVNYDPAFIAWLENTQDGNSGMAKAQTLSMAVDNRNVGQVVKFFEEWNKLQGGLPPAQKPFNPQSRVAPAKAGQSPAPQQTKRTYTGAEYMQIGKDMTAGKYSKADYVKVKAEMDSAVAEGRIKG